MKIFNILISLFLFLSIPMMVVAEEGQEGISSDLASEQMMDNTTQERFNLSGFMAARYTYYDWEDKDNMMTGTVGNKNHYAVDNLNLYFLFNIDKNWLAFSEVQFLYSPQGKIKKYNFDYKDNTVNQSAPVDNLALTNQSTISYYGGVAIERAYIEWNRYGYFKVRAGQYLTPFGIWSQDHGDPALTSVRAPYLAGSTFQQYGMPTNQTGLELLGSVAIPNTEIEVDWAAYTGNGISSTTNINDRQDARKSFGGFLNFKISSILDFIDLEIGVSGYMGDRTIHEYDDSITGRYYRYKQDDKIATGHLKLSMYDLPFDGTFVFQAEGMRQWYEEDKNVKLTQYPYLLYPSAGVATGLIRTAQNSKFDVYYAQAEYNLYGWITPYFRYEYMKLHDQLFANVPFNGFDEINIYITGLNVKPISRITLKFELGIYDSSSALSSNNNDWKIYQASISAAF